MRPGRSFRYDLDLTPESLIEVLERDECVAQLSEDPSPKEEFVARVDGRWLELRHAQSPGLTPVLCLELEALADGGTGLRGRWVHGQWEVALRALMLLYGCMILVSTPLLFGLPGVAAAAILSWLALAWPTLRPLPLKGERRSEAERIAGWLSERIGPYRRDLPLGAGDPFRRPALPQG